MKGMGRNLGRQSRNFLPMHWLLLSLAIGLFEMPAIAQNVTAPKNLSESLPEGDSQTRVVDNSSLRITSVAEAERLLNDAELQRDSINARYKDEEAQCFTRFFVTSCIDDAKERRRVGLRSVRFIEVQANAFKRAYKAEQRDKALQRKTPTDLNAPVAPQS